MTNFTKAQDVDRLRGQTAAAAYLANKEATAWATYLNRARILAALIGALAVVSIAVAELP